MWLKKSKQKEQEEFGSDDDAPSGRSSHRSRGGKRGGGGQNRIEVLGYKPFSKCLIQNIAFNSRLFLQALPPN